MFLEPYQKQPIENIIFNGGNRCGHDKYNPALSLSLPSQNRPSFLYSVGAAFKQYFFNPDIFPTLKYAFSNRQQRSERREAVVVTMLAILEFLDLASLRVGIPTENGFQPLSLKVLQRRTRLTERRFDRAIQTLSQAGILKVSDQLKYRHPITGKWIYFPSVRKISYLFFECLGMGKQVKEEMKAASERLKAKAAAAGLKLAQMAKFRIDGVAKAYRERRARREDAINTKLTRQAQDLVQEEAKLLQSQGLDAVSARREALRRIGKIARQRKRKSKAFLKALEEAK